MEKSEMTFVQILKWGVEGQGPGVQIQQVLSEPMTINSTFTKKNRNLLEVQLYMEADLVLGNNSAEIDDYMRDRYPITVLVNTIDQLLVVGAPRHQNEFLLAPLLRLFTNLYVDIDDRV